MTGRYENKKKSSRRKKITLIVIGITLMLLIVLVIAGAAYYTTMLNKINKVEVPKIVYTQIASASWTPAGRNFVIIATVLVGASDSTKIGAAAAGQAA